MYSKSKLSANISFFFLFSGDDKKAEVLLHEIAELDERAKELDKARTSSISSISYINERNRKKNVEEAEKAIMVSNQKFSCIKKRKMKSCY